MRDAWTEQKGNQLWAIISIVPAFLLTVFAMVTKNPLDYWGSGFIIGLTAMGWITVFLVKRERKKIDEDYVEKKPKQCSTPMLHNFSPDHDTMESLYKSKCEWCGIPYKKLVTGKENSFPETKEVETLATGE